MAETAVLRDRSFCPTCANDAGAQEIVEGRCRRCRDKKTHIDGAARVAGYRGRLGELLRGYKYDDREELEPLLGAWLAEAVTHAPWLERAEAVVPVPTHWRHRVSRRLYPAERLCRIVGTRADRPTARILRRTRGGPHQVGLSYTRRLANVRGAFALRRGVRLDDARILLIDDVMTTGATLEECAKVLKRAGAAKVYVAVVVKVEWAGVGHSLLAAM